MPVKTGTNQITSQPANKFGYSWKSPVFYHLFPLVLYFLAALVFTWPQVLHLGNEVILSRSSDVWQNFWNLWWTPFSIFKQHTQPFFTSFLFFPDGANLYFHALNPLTALFSAPLQVAFGLVTTFALVQFIQLTLAGYCAYLLARYLTGQFAPALVAGFIYGFNPLQSEFLNLGQLELSASFWLPLFVLSFLKTVQGEGKNLKGKVTTALILVALTFTTWYYTAFALLFCSLYLVWQLVKVRRDGWADWRKHALNLLWSLGIWVVLVSPVMLFSIKDLISGSSHASQPLGLVIINSADLSGFFKPGASALWGFLGTGDNLSIRGQFLGFATLALVMLGLVFSWRKTRFWLFIALSFLVLALGPVLHLSFSPDWKTSSPEVLQGLPLPGRLLFELPLGNILRVPLRFIIFVMLAFSVIASFGLVWLGNRFDQIKSPFQNISSYSIVVLACLLVFLEFLPVPRTLTGTDIPQVYRQIQAEDKNTGGALLEIPEAIIHQAMYFQTAHNLPITGGYLSRTPPGFSFLGTLGINEKLEDLQNPDLFEAGRMENLLTALPTIGVRYLVIHPELYTPEDRATMLHNLETLFGTTKAYYRDDEVIVYKLPEPAADARPEPGKVFPKLGNGWNGRDFLNKDVNRSINNRSLVTLISPFHRSLKTTLTLTVRSLEQAYNLKISLNGKNVFARWVSTASKDITVPLELDYGQNELVFEVEGAGSNVPTLIFSNLKLQ